MTNRIRQEHAPPVPEGQTAVVLLRSPLYDASFFAFGDHILRRRASISTWNCRSSMFFIHRRIVSRTYMSTEQTAYGLAALPTASLATIAGSMRGAVGPGGARRGEGGGR